MKKNAKFRKSQKCPRCQKGSLDKFPCGRHNYIHLFCKTCNWSNF